MQYVNKKVLNAALAAGLSVSSAMALATDPTSLIDFAAMGSTIATTVAAAVTAGLALAGLIKGGKIALAFVQRLWK